MDTVFIDDLRVDTVIGIYDWERKIRQTVALDLQMDWGVAHPAATDSIADTLDYKGVAKRVISFVESSRFQLVETLAQKVAELILVEFGVSRVRLKLSKPGAVTHAQAVGVVIERTRAEISLRRVYLSIGSNIQAEENICACVAALRDRFGAVVCSTVYRCPAEGFDGAEFLNLVVGLDTDLEPLALKGVLQQIEVDQGRERKAQRFSDRTLDIDILIFSDQTEVQPELNLPRGEIRKFAFVLGPLAEIAPTLIHPQVDRSMADLWLEFTRQSHRLSATTIVP